MHARFVVDIMLGRLARWLRAMGYDTLYPGPAPGHAGDRRLLQIARSEARVLVTRDRMLARLAADRGCWIRAESPDEQIVEVVTGLQLAPREGDRLSRCLDCNAPLEARDKAAVAGRVPDHVLATQSAFKACPACSKIYWAGTHVERMLARLDRLVGAG
jgi:hypothetical protein